MSDIVKVMARAMWLAGARRPDKVEQWDVPGLMLDVDREYQIEKAAAAVRHLLDAGYVLVPVEPTEEMRREGVTLALRSALSGGYKWPDYVAALYAAMIAAAQVTRP